MALITCPDCGKSISDQAVSCNGCGRPMVAGVEGKFSPGSAESVKKGTQRSKLRGDLGQAFALVGIMVAVFVGMATTALTGIIVALVAIAIGAWISYGS